MKLLAENGQRLMREVSIVGEGGIGHRGLGEEGEETACASRRRKLEVALELVEQAAKLIEQSRILVQFVSPWCFGSWGCGSDLGLGITNRGQEKGRRDDSCALEEIALSLLESLCVSHGVFALVRNKLRINSFSSPKHLLMSDEVLLE